MRWAIAVLVVAKLLEPPTTDTMFEACMVIWELEAWEKEVGIFKGARPYCSREEYVPVVLVR